MKRLFLLHLSLVLPLLVLMLAAIQVGAQVNHVPPVLRRGCDAPCWNGIKPGEMSIDAANQILFSQGYEPQNAGGERITYVPGEDNRRRCTIRLTFDNAIVNETRLSNCPALRLGDVLAAWGAPDGILHTAMTLSFERGMARIRLVSAEDCEYDLSPFTEIHSIRFARTPGLLPNEIRWRGFKPAWSYKQISPHTIPLDC